MLTAKRVRKYVTTHCRPDPPKGKSVEQGGQLKKNLQRGCQESF